VNVQKLSILVGLTSSRKPAVESVLSFYCDCLVQRRRLINVSMTCTSCTIAVNNRPGVDP